MRELPTQAVPREAALHDVAIVGFGPAGALLANLLGRLGLAVVVLEKDAAVYPLPRAIHFDGEVMRIFQNAGLREQVLAISRPGTQGMHFVNAQGQTLLIRGGTAELGPHGAANNYYFHQPELEAVLRAGAAQLPSVDVQLGHEVLAVAQDADSASLTVQAPGGAPPQTLRARYVVGCDGARSLVRKAMGSCMEDLGLHQPWLVFDALLHEEVALPAYTVQLCDPARPMTYCNVVGRRRRWEIMLLPGDDPAELVRPERLWPLVARWIRPEQAELERAVVYTFHSVIAQGWRRGRLLLAGDSAHQTPPFLGQGMCAGLRDAANLAWKLEAVLRGRAGAALLDSYEAERSPHVRAFIDLAVRLGGIIQTTDPEAARERDARFRSGAPEVFEFPTPALGGEDSRAGSHAAVGRPFPQPRLASGRLLDELLGPRFAVIGSAPLLRGAQAATYDRWRHAGALVLGQHGEPLDAALQAWLEAQGVGAVVLRPDRYVLGVARSAAELDLLTQRLADQLLAVPSPCNDVTTTGPLP